MSLNQLQSSNYRKIAFIRAVRSDSAVDPSSEQEFVILNPSTKHPQGREAAESTRERFDEMEAKHQPRELFKESSIQLKWQTIHKAVRTVNGPPSLML